jgi:Fe-S oxidoreductase
MKIAPKSLRDKNWRYLTMLKSPMPPASPFSLWDLLPDCAAGETIIFNTKKTAKKTVFYFPGCGSERLYGQIGAASLYILLKNDFRVVVPPPFLCCGFPARFNAKKKMHAEINLRDSIVLSQIRDMLGYLVFDAFVVSCGTCREALSEIGVENIFDCPIKDVSGYIFEKGEIPAIKIPGEIFYHAPCHDSLETHGQALLAQLHEKVTNVPNCCSESGTMSLSRPDITDKMLRRKRDSLRLAGASRADTLT